jgi:hypothetical protein
MQHTTQMTKRLSSQITEILKTANTYVVDQVTEVLAAYFNSGSTASTRRSSRSKSSNTSRADARRTKIYSAISAGKSKASVMSRFNLTDYQYRGFKASLKRGHGVTA